MVPESAPPTQPPRDDAGATDDGAPSFSVASLLRTAETLVPVVFVLIVACTVATWALTPPLRPNDLGWHLAQGRWMVESGRVLAEDVFNYPNRGHALVNEYVLYQLLLYSLVSVNERLVAALNVLAWLFICLAPIVVAWRSRGLGVITASMVIVTLVLSGNRMNFRPEVFTCLGLVVTMLWLLSYLRRPPRAWWEFWPLGLLQTVWAGFHSGFVLGLVIYAAFACEALVREVLANRAVAQGEGKPLSLIAALSSSHILAWAGGFALLLTCCMINPFGYQRLLLPFYHQGSYIIKLYTTEMQPLAWSLDEPFAVMLALGLTITIAAYATFRFQGSYAALAFSLAMTYAAMDTQRHVPLACLAMLCAVASAACMGQAWNLLSRSDVRASRMAVLAFAVSVLAILLLSEWDSAAGDSRPQGPPDISTRSPWEFDQHGMGLSPSLAVQWMRRPDIALDGKLLNRTELGGYLQWKGFDAGQCFTDTGFGKFPGWMVQLSGLVANRPAMLPAIAQRYQADTAVVGVLSYAWTAPLRSMGWRLVFYHPCAQIYVRPGFREDLPTVSAEEVQRIYMTFVGKGLPSGPPYMAFHYLLAIKGMTSFWSAGKRAIPCPPKAASTGPTPPS